MSTTLTNTQLLTRIVALETAVNALQNSMNNLVTKRDVNALFTVRQNEIEQLKQQIDTLQSQVTILQTSL